MDTALLIIDIQNDYFEHGALPLVNAEQASKNAGLILERFRKNSNPVVFIQHLNLDKKKPYLLPNSSGSELHAHIQPNEGEKVITKYFPNSFLKTNLLEHLQNLKVQNLVICGMMTHMCVDTTVRAAKDLGFNITLIGDACATKNLELNGQITTADEVQRSFLAAMNGYFASVKTTEYYLSES